MTMWTELKREEKLEIWQVAIACLIGVPIAVVLFAMLKAIAE